MMKREFWIDLLRGCCMLLIILDHTEICFTGVNIIPYDQYVPDVLMVFFFLSGYLFYRPQGFDIRHKIQSWGRGIVMPYFIFVALLAVPKALLHGNDIMPTAMLWQIITGQESWFIAALAVDELVLTGILWLTQEKMPAVSGCFFVTIGVSVIFSSGAFRFYPDYWHINEAMVALCFLLLGYLCHRILHQRRQPSSSKSVAPTQRLILSLIILLSFIVVASRIIIFTHPNETTQVDALVLPHSFLWGTTAVVLLSFLLFRKIPQSTDRPLCVCAIDWVGRHSIVYYFFCSGIPTAVTVVLRHMGYTYMGHHWEVIPVFLINVFLITVITYLIYRYIPWITGRKS